MMHFLFGKKEKRAIPVIDIQYFSLNDLLTQRKLINGTKSKPQRLAGSGCVWINTNHETNCVNNTFTLFLCKIENKLKF